jgi:cytochrome P450 family 710 subfamily A protein
MEMTGGFLTFPLKFPGTAVWRAMKGRQYILSILEQAAIRSKERMRGGAEPSCLLDFWTQQILRDCEEAEAANVPPPKYSSNHEMAYTVMDFLFASQDASTASLVWLLTQMAEHPDVLERVRQEQRAARPDLAATITGETLTAMPYTRQVVKEVLRFRPPAPMVPQVAMRPFQLTPEYTAPKGAFIIPDIVSACHQGYSNPESFDPDRFSPERKEDVTYAGNFLVFGHGPHYCVGKEYAINHLMAFLAITSTSLDWQRTRTPESDWIKYLPTIYPSDSIFTFSSTK